MQRGYWRQSILQNVHLNEREVKYVEDIKTNLKMTLCENERWSEVSQDRFHGEFCD
jgi:hypothetical protein